MSFVCTVGSIYYGPNSTTQVDEGRKWHGVFLAIKTPPKAQTVVRGGERRAVTSDLSHDCNGRKNRRLRR